LIEIREEHPDDAAAIRDLNRRAFGQDLEGNIVDALRSNGAILLSLVATLNDRVVGHIMYSAASVNGDASGAALGPMAVLPEYQRQGIGSQLVEAGNRKLKAAGCPFIILVGHPSFYPRFGFTLASARGIRCEWEVPDEAFMLLFSMRQRCRVSLGWRGTHAGSQPFRRPPKMALQRARRWTPDCQAAGMTPRGGAQTQS
jgi:putative acetyltransferase